MSQKVNIYFAQRFHCDGSVEIQRKVTRNSNSSRWTINGRVATEQEVHRLNNYGADHKSCTGGARITAEGGSLKRDLRAGSVCLSVCMSVRHATYCDVT